MHAVENHNERLIRFLVCFHANPCSRRAPTYPETLGRSCIDLCEDARVLAMLHRAAQLRVGLGFVSGWTQRHRWWRRQVLSLFDPEGALTPWHDRILLFKNA